MSPQLEGSPTTRSSSTPSRHPPCHALERGDPPPRERQGKHSLLLHTCELGMFSESRSFNVSPW